MTDLPQVSHVKMFGRYDISMTIDSENLVSRRPRHVLPTTATTESQITVSGRF